MYQQKEKILPFKLDIEYHMIVKKEILDNQFDHRLVTCSRQSKKHCTVLRNTNSLHVVVDIFLEHCEGLCTEMIE